MMDFLWIKGLLRHRPLRLIGSGFGIAVSVALLASLGFFLIGSTASMTSRATGPCRSTGRSRQCPEPTQRH